MSETRERERESTSVMFAGTPSPRLEWSSPPTTSTTSTTSTRADLYSRQLTEEGTAVLSLGLVTRDSAGSYTCSADNGYTETPVRRTVIVQVQYSPSLTVRERTIHTAKGEEEELVCRVTGVPSPSLTWYRNNNIIDRRTNNVLINQRAGRHSLTVLNIDEGSVGQYRCVATNSEGSVSQLITLTGSRLTSYPHSIMSSHLFVG